DGGDELGYGLVPVEAGVAGRAKTAPDRTSDLRAHADRRARPRAGGCLVVHDNRLDGASVVQFEQILDGLTAIRRALELRGDGAEGEGLVQLTPRRWRQGPHRLEGR